MSSSSEMMSALQQQFAEQKQVFIGLQKMNEAQKAELFNNLKDIDLEVVKKLKSVVQAKEKEPTVDPVKIEPFLNLVSAEMTDNATRSSWVNKGYEMIAEGKVAVLLMAGGQGTRLGSDLPKGQYNIGLLSGKRLFQLQAERLQTLRALVAKNCQSVSQETVYDLESSPEFIPWYIMTSPATHQPSIDFFQSKDYFGYPKEYVYFFEQGTLPAMTSDGKIIMETFTKPSRSPNGNGGVYAALADTGALADMKTRGVSHVFVYPVDNLLVQVADPEFIGYCAINNVDFGNKVLEKTDPTESVGVLAIKDGKAAVVEYSELPEQLAQEINSDGSLVYRAANIAIHCLSIPFIEKTIATDIPYHVAHKKISFVDEHGKTVKPAYNNGVKLEKFIFDGLALAESPSALMVRREGNFAAVKNAPNKSLPDSPESARLALSEYHQSLILKAGGAFMPVDDDDTDTFCEISPLVSYNGENLEERVKGRTFLLPLHLR